MEIRQMKRPVRATKIRLSTESETRKGSGPGRERRPRPDDLPETATIIALDPGGTTGWSMMSFHPDALVPEAGVGFLENLEDWKHGQIDCGSKKGNLGISHHSGISTDGENAGVNEVSGLLRAWPGATVVIEDFDLRIFNKDRDLLSPVRITAAIGYDLWKQNRVYFTQSPSRKPEANDDRLRNWNLYERNGGMVHARDADRHAIIFARRCVMPGKSGRELREAAWPHLYGKGRPYAV